MALQLLTGWFVMRNQGPVALRSQMGGLIVPLRDEYDRELLFEHIANRVMHDRWVEVSLPGQRWHATLVARCPSVPCSSCGDVMTIAHASGGTRLCTRCRMRALH